MVSFTVRLRFNSEDVEKVREHLRALTLESRKEPGCVTYVAHLVEDEPTTVVIYEQYVDRAAHEFHRTTPHFHEHAIGGFLQYMKDRSVENLIALV